MTALDERLQTRNADKAQALGEIAAVLAMIDGEHRDPEPWERLCLQPHIGRVLSSGRRGGA